MARGVEARRTRLPSPARARFTGRGKLLFFGEHAAVYGFPAVGVTLPLGIRIALERSPYRTGRLHGVPQEYRGKFDELLDATREILGDPEVFSGFDIRLESDLPAGRGLGSSASLCVALVAAGARGDFPGRATTAEAVWEYAHRAERLFHGRSSGIDTGLASGSGLAALYPRSDGLPERRSLSPVPFWLVAGTVPRSGAARDHIRAVGEGYAEGRKATVETIRELGLISERAIAAFSLSRSSSDLIDALAPLADAAQERLASLGLSTPALEETLAAGRRAGGRVGKLSGAGGGGAFYFLAEDRASAARLHAAVAEALCRRGDGSAPLGPFFWTGSKLEADAFLQPFD